MRLLPVFKLDNRFFLDEFDALAHKKISRIEGEPEDCFALQSGNNYCLASPLPGYGFIATFKEKNKIYAATIKPHSVEIGAEATTLKKECTYIYISQDGKLYSLKGLILIEAPRLELSAAKNSFFSGVEQARRNIAAEQTARQQPTLLQFFGQFQRLGISTAPAASTRSSDPMDVDTQQTENGYDYWGVSA